MPTNNKRTNNFTLVFSRKYAHLFFCQMLSHPNVLTLWDTFIDRGELCLVSRYHDRNLQQAWMHSCRHLDFSSVTRYANHVALGLAHMHAHGLAHRDVSMPNLLVSFSDNVVQLADFGLATCASSLVLERNVACPHCRAPEVILTYTADTDATALRAESATQDLWSLSCVIVPMVHGRFLFLPRSRTEGGPLCSSSSSTFWPRPGPGGGGGV